MPNKARNTDYDADFNQGASNNKNSALPSASGDTPNYSPAVDPSGANKLNDSPLFSSGGEMVHHQPLSPLVNIPVAQTKP